MFIELYLVNLILETLVHCLRNSIPGPSCSKAEQRLTRGLNLMRVSFSCVQKHFLGQFLYYFYSFQSSTCRQKELKLECF